MSRICNRTGLVALAVTVLWTAGCTTVPPAVEQPPEPAPLETPPAEALEPALPPMIGPMPPTLEALETFDRALAAMQDDEFEEASELLQELLQGNPDLVGAQVNLGIARLRLDDAAGARQAFDQALALQPGHPVVLNQLAILERRAGRFGQAEGLYRKALDGTPDYPPLHLNLGILCDLYLRQADCALTHYARYVELEGAQAETVGLWIVDLERRTGRNQ